MALPKMYIKKIKNKKICFGNCGNAIAENVKKIYIYILAISAMGLPQLPKNIYIYIYIFFLAIVAMTLPKMEKKLWNLWMSKKKNCHVHNIFTINHTWLIIISSKNLWQINCGNGIAEKGKKKFVLAIVAMPLPKMEKKKNLWNLWMSKRKSCHVHNIFTIFSQ